MQGSIALLALGDISLHGFSPAQFEQSAEYQALVRRLSNYEGITLANLECALTTDENLNFNKIALHANPKLLQELPRVDLFSLANNHISDAWDKGVQDTMQALNQQHKVYFGYGRDIFEARKPAIIERNGIRLGFLGYSCLTTNGENYATCVQSGVCPLASDYLEADISRLKKEVDHVVLALHWGEEGAHYPTPDQIAVGHRAIDNGASVVIGLHPHAIQGIERYKDGYICYSLGNFIFSDIEYETRAQGEASLWGLKLTNCNKESIGVEFCFKRGKVKLNSIEAFKLDRYFLPTEVPLKSFNINLNHLNTKLKAYSERKARYLQKINGPQITIKFNGKYQNRYLFNPINEYQTSFRLRSILNRIKSRILQ